MTRKMIVSLLGTLALLVFSVNLSATSINLLTNAGFETAASGVTPGTAVTDMLNGALGSTAAADWIVYANVQANNLPSTITTTLLPSTLPGGGQFMIEVNETGTDNGLGQDFLSTPATSATASAWIFIKSGCVGIGSGNDGDTGIDTSSCTTGKWIQLTSPNGSTPVTAFIVYDTSIGADFFVDNAAVLTGTGSTVPEPASLLLMATGVFGLAFLVRRRHERTA